MKKNRIPNEPEHQVTSESAFWNRRKFIQAFGAASATVAAMPIHADLFGGLFGGKEKPKSNLASLKFIKNAQYSSTEQLTSEKSVTTYNNFYEFGLGKDDPHKNAQDFVTNPWQVSVDGLCEKKGTFDLDDLIRGIDLEERIYRLRCVEAWSMVVPWVGISLASLLKSLKPSTDAKYVVFKTLYDPKQMPGQKPGYLGFSSLNYPYVEGLRIDEAMNELAFMATGVYGKQLPPQNGAPFRLVVPWKYGFKSIKSVVSISFTDRQPINSWKRSQSSEYGFFANVNPQVDHPRWSQASERRIVDGSLLSVKRIPTQMFNGYQQHVAGLYKGMDLRTHF
jgi:methionine sulfoxide reductase catalytic subunit